MTSFVVHYAPYVVGILLTVSIFAYITTHLTVVRDRRARYYRCHGIHARWWQLVFDRLDCAFLSFLGMIPSVALMVYLHETEMPTLVRFLVASMPLQCWVFAMYLALTSGPYKRYQA